MFIFIKIFKKLSDSVYDIRHPLSKRDEIILEHSLKNMGIKKVYQLNNVMIQSSQKRMDFYYENDISVDIKDGYIIRDYELKPCPPFNFYRTDNEEVYELYSGSKDDIDIQLKSYNDFFTIEYITDKVSNILPY
ncbi:MAG: hypothetical protein CL779_00190 [Chloroflexi bacterium]|nr:hypothetical protein [Chloroflexota bacterium]|tara:strand:- start:1265 stop:1666 length:402 start_codon:yes stop_codon:yes gene_type:complete